MKISVYISNLVKFRKSKYGQYGHIWLFETQFEQNRTFCAKNALFGAKLTKNKFQPKESNV